MTTFDLDLSKYSLGWSDEVEYAFEPKKGIDAGVVDQVLTPEDIPQVLEKYARHPYVRDVSADPQPSEEPPPEAAGEEGFEAIIALMQAHAKHDFRKYKPNTLMRRTRRRMCLHHIDDFPAYLSYLRAHPHEIDALAQDLLIAVTDFFREPQAWEALRELAVRPLVQRTRPDDTIRLWTPGCTTGEEPYSIAMLILEQLKAAGKNSPLNVFASDVDKRALDLARAGRYPKSITADVSRERLNHFFTAHDGNDFFHVNKVLRETVVFADQNLIADPPFSKLDLLCCRNLLIYLKPEVQEQVIALFHFALREGGILFLGSAETIGSQSDLFEPLDRRWRIFRRKGPTRHDRVNIPISDLPHRREIATPSTPQRRDTHLAHLAQQRLIDVLAPSAVLIDSHWQILYVSGDVDPYLTHKSGMPTDDLLDKARRGLRSKLRVAVKRALSERRSVSVTARVQRDRTYHRVKIMVRLVHNREQDEDLALVLFDEADPVVRPSQEDSADSDRDSGGKGRSHSSIDDKSPAASAGFADEEVDDHAVIRQLEEELAATKDDLQASVEQRESSNEEIKASNEEVMSINEELQSTNEELHSVNEELYTVNAEYQHKIDELTELTAEVDAQLQSTEAQVIFLDQDLRIRKFTPSVEKTFNLVPQDVGRRLDSFQHNIEHPALLDGLEQVLSEQKKVEREVRAGDGRWFLLRILPFRKKEAISGVVLTLIDINTLRRTRNELWTVQQQFAAIMNRSASIVFVKSLDGKYVMANRAMSKVFGKPIDRIIGHTSEELVGSSAAEAMLRSDAQVLETGQEVQIEESLEIQGRAYHFVVSKFPLRDRQGNLVGLAGIKTDVTDLKRAETEAREAVAQRDRFLAMLSHELRNPLAAILSAASLVQRSVDDGDEILQPCEVIGRQAAQMSTLLDDLLDVARITHGTIRLRHEPCELASVCKEAIEAVGSMVADKRHELDMEPGDEPVWVTGDRARLLQVFENLLTNAAKYTPPGGKILVRIASESDEAVVQDIDNGIGIAAPLRSRIFEMFVQTDDSLDRRQGGMGLGLTLVKSLVLLHGGSVDVESDGMGQGSRFTVRLPLTAQRSESRAENDARPQDRAGNSDRLKIVLVEDNDDVRELLASLLVTEGHDVVTAPDGIAGRDKILEHQPDVALIDIGLPGMNGYKIARAIRKQSGNESTRLIALTGYGRREDQRAANKAGFHAHLVKPIRIEALRRALAAEQEKRSASSN